MEILVALRKPELINKIRNYANGIIVGSLFSLSYPYTPKQLLQIKQTCEKIHLKVYVAMDCFVSEQEVGKCYSYLEYLKKLNVSGIYFHDLSILGIAKKLNMLEKMIYDGYSLMCNSIEAAYFLGLGVNSVVLSRELTYREIKKIVTMNKHKIDLQVFGHLRMSYSKRRFIQNYFNEIHQLVNYEGKESLSLVEEKRNYKMPIIEDYNGTRIYTDFVFEMFKEYCELKEDLNRVIIDGLFLNSDLVAEATKKYASITLENAEFLKNELHNQFPGRYSKGYLYQKTNITKE